MNKNMPTNYTKQIPARSSDSMKASSAALHSHFFPFSRFSLFAQVFDDETRRESEQY